MFSWWEDTNTHTPTHMHIQTPTILFADWLLSCTGTQPSFVSMFGSCIIKQNAQGGKGHFKGLQLLCHWLFVVEGLVDVPSLSPEAQPVFEGELAHTYSISRYEQTDSKNVHQNIHIHKKKQLLFTVLMRGASLAHTCMDTQNHAALPCIFLLCGSHTLAALLRKQQSGFLRGLGVKGRLWLHARHMTGNIEIWLSSGIALLYVLVLSAMDGM